MKKKLRRGLSLAFSCFLAVAAFAQVNRTLDGHGNNQSFPDRGAAHSNLLYPGTLGYADGISEPGGADWPNPRVISNQLFSQNSLLNDPRGMSAYTWGFGQFIDHDITLVENHPTESYDVSVPPYDAFFDPAGNGTATIPVARSKYDENTGTSTSNFRRHVNSITAFIDGSGVYGSDEERANWLRTFSNGKLKTSSGDMLPFNTTTGEFNAPVDNNAPVMDMPFPFMEKWFIAGDPRANENAFLTSIHTLFMREHNRICDELIEKYPDWTDEQLYQYARKIVGAEIEAIVYEEWLPAMGLDLADYDGYKFFVHPGITNDFSAAAFRYGHTTINNMLMRMNHDGNTMPQGNIFLKDAFFNPNAVMEVDGIDPYLQGMATVVQQDFDAKVIDDLRNFLFGQPGSGGMDLVSINIQRGRERGLTDFNTMRMSYGLSPVNDFSGINSDPLFSQSIEFTYNGEIDNIDAWVGIVSESHLPGSMFGETAAEIIALQFEALRDGDRYYYENDPNLSEEDKSWIKEIRLADIILKNTEIEHIQDKIFFAEPLVSSTSENDFEQKDLGLSIFPNPVNDILNLSVESKLFEPAMISISSINGNKLFDKKANLAPGNNLISFNLENNIPSGLYILTINSESGKSTNERFLKID